MTNLQAENHYELWGFFAHELPATFNYNVNILVKWANGVKITLHSLVPIDPLEVSAALESGRYNAGDVVTLTQPPKAVYVTVNDLGDAATAALLLLDLPTTLDGRPLVPLLPCEETSAVSLGRDSIGPISVNVYNPGYSIDLGGTIHGVQGDTCRRLCADLNLPSKGARTLQLQSVYVSSSRVRLGQHFRIVPWNSAGKAHMLRLQHDPRLTQFFNCIRDGIFHPPLTLQPQPRPVLPRLASSRAPVGPVATSAASIRARVRDPLPLRYAPSFLFQPSLSSQAFARRSRARPC